MDLNFDQNHSVAYAFQGNVNFDIRQNARWLLNILTC